MPELRQLSDPSDEPQQSLADELKGYARKALGRASDADSPQASLNHMQAAHEALKAAQLASEPVTDAEREATAEQVASLHQRLWVLGRVQAQACTESGHLAQFLRKLAGEFESAGTDTAARVASRIRLTLHDVLGAEPDEEESEQPT